MNKTLFPHRAMLRISALCLLAAIVPAWAQITIDWGAKPKYLVSYPKTVNDRVSTQVIVGNVNNLLYTYEVNLIATPRILDDAAGLIGAGAAANKALDASGVSTNDGCAIALRALNSAATGLSEAIRQVFDCKQHTTFIKDGNAKTATVSETIADWNKTAKPLLEKLTDKSPDLRSAVAVKCSAEAYEKQRSESFELAQKAVDLANEKQKLVDAPHRIVQEVTLSPETDYEVIVVEKCGDTETARFSAKFSPSSDILTLSLGTLLSGIQQRTYVTAKDPQDTTRDLLSIDGTGRFSPLGLAMLNYRLPRLTTPGGEVGMDLSSGVVLRFGGNQVSASALGFFIGPSVHLYNRLFFTVGAHFGQFSDFPPGLVRGSIIPANYGTPTGVSRSTTRFGFGVSYRTAAFAPSAAKPATSEKAPAKKTVGDSAP